MDVFQEITREEQIAALKTIEKPFGLWPNWLRECEVCKELEDRPVWESCDGGFVKMLRLYNNTNSFRLSPSYEDKPKACETTIGTERKKVDSGYIRNAERLLHKELLNRLDQKGFGTFTSKHEIYGVLAEEVFELLQAIQRKLKQMLFVCT